MGGGREGGVGIESKFGYSMEASIPVSSTYGKVMPFNNEF